MDFLSSIPIFITIKTSSYVELTRQSISETTDHILVSRQWNGRILYKIVTYREAHLKFK